MNGLGFETNGRDSWWGRFEVAWAVVGGAALAGVCWSMLCTAPGIPWNAARLTPSFALARGLPIYALRESGAHLGWVYGPVFPLWYVPAGLTDNPTVGLMLAAGWNLFTILAPLYLVVRVATGGAGRLAWFLFVLAALLLLANPITRAAFLFLHVDAVSVGWAVVACLALHAAAGRNWGPGLPLAAAAVALSVAAKQVSIALVPATLLWLWRAGHARLLGRWIFWLAVVCGGLAALSFVAFGGEGMLFNAWLLFSRMPWQGGWDIVGRNLAHVVAASWLWLLAALLGGAVPAFSMARSAESGRGGARRAVLLGGRLAAASRGYGIAGGGCGAQFHPCPQLLLSRGAGSDGSLAGWRGSEGRFTDPI